MADKRNLLGKLIGRPFTASVDRSGARIDRANSVLIVKEFLVPSGYLAYIFDKSFPEEYIINFARQSNGASIVCDVEDVSGLVDYDVITVSSNGLIQRIYRDDSGDNVLFITNCCNSNCIMCPDSMASRTRELGITKESLLNLLGLIPDDTHHLTITGGEPTLLKWDLLAVLKACKERFENTLFLMLTNGRSLCVEEYRKAFLESLPNHFRVGIPLYGTDAKSHDAITQAPGSFEQTTAALKAIQFQTEVEIRIVVMSFNFKQLPLIAQYIASNLPGIHIVNFMGMELLGSAAINRDKLWVDYSDTVPYLEKAILILLKAGIDSRIYNYPLCSLPEKLWSLSEKSISDYKVLFRPECDACTVKQYCGGFFFSTIQYEKVKINPIKEERSHAAIQ